MAFVPALPSFAPKRFSASSSRQFARPRPAVARTPARAVLHKAREVTADELEQVLQANERPLLVDAFAQWCGPCQFMVPQLDIVADKYGDKLDIVKFDTEAFPDLASALMIRGLPTLFFIKDGKLQYRMEGALAAEELGRLIDYIFFDGPPPTPVEPSPGPRT